MGFYVPGLARRSNFGSDWPFADGSSARQPAPKHQTVSSLPRGARWMQFKRDNPAGIRSVGERCERRAVRPHYLPPSVLAPPEAFELTCGVTMLNQKSKVSR